jgi:hypothetical protein
LIIESGFANTIALLARLGLQVRGADEERAGFGNAAKLSRIALPVLIIHGQDDVLIPASDAHELHRRCASPDKRLVLIPRAGHNDLMMVGMKTYMDAIRRFVGTTLERRGSACKGLSRRMVLPRGGASLALSTSNFRRVSAASDVWGAHGQSGI